MTYLGLLWLYITECYCCFLYFIRLMSLSSVQSNSRETRIGPTFQANLPDYQANYSTESKATLLWAPSPHNIPDITMVTRELYELGYSRQTIIESIFSHSYDLQGVKNSLSEMDTQEWTTADKDSFELGLQEFGKHFDVIQSDYLPHKPIPELVGYYYKWRLNRPISKVDLKLKCYLENQENVHKSQTKPFRKVAWISDTTSDNISVTVDEIKEVLSDKSGSEMRQLNSKSKQNKMKIQTNKHDIILLNNKLAKQEIEKLRPKSFHNPKETRKNILLKRGNENLNFNTKRIKNENVA